MDVAVDVAHVEVGADGIGGKSLSQGGDAVAKPEAGSAVTDVEVNAPPARLEHVVEDDAAAVDDRELTGEHVSVDVPGAQVL